MFAPVTATLLGLKLQVRLEVLLEMWMVVLGPQVWLEALALVSKVVAQLQEASALVWIPHQKDFSI